MAPSRRVLGGYCKTDFSPLKSVVETGHGQREAMSATTRQATQTSSRDEVAPRSDMDEVLELRRQAAAITQRIDRLMAALLAADRERPVDA